MSDLQQEQSQPRSFDAIIVGGSFAGLSAAMQLARARRRVMVIDAGLPRNRFAHAVHGFFGQDGRPPREVLLEATRQVGGYPTVTLVKSEAVTAAPAATGFAVALADGTSALATRLVLATGVRDELPAIPGLKERWGITAVHCPYCHGYELADGPLGVIAGHAKSAHQATLLPDWGPTTYFTQGGFEPDAETAALLRARGVTIERTPVAELLGTAPRLDAVRLSDGRVLPMRAVYVSPKTLLASPLAGQLGCAMEDGLTGPFVRVDDFKQTSVPGVFAAGDAASPMHSASLASTAGAMAGVGAHQSLVMAAATAHSSGTTKQPVMAR